MHSNTETNKNMPHNLNKVVPLDFKSVPSVPDTHKWSLDTEKPIVEPEPMPLIDLSDPNAKSLMRSAFEKWGAFQIINHGVPMNLLEEVELQAFRLFSLPIDQKLCALRSPDGPAGYGQPVFSVYFPKHMWTESFLVMGSPMEHATKLWPHQSTQQTDFCTTMEEYQKEIKRLAERVLEMTLESLGLSVADVEWLKKPKTDEKENQDFVQMNSFPVCPEPDQAMGLGQHTDSSLITIVHQNNCSGLQVHRDGIGWVTVQPSPGALEVNAGDMMQILTNDRFKSNLHRAVVNNTRHRVSLAYFYGPPKDAKLSPLTGLTGRDHPPLYPSLTWKEYIEEKKKSAYTNIGSLDFLKKV